MYPSYTCVPKGIKRTWMDRLPSDLVFYYFRETNLRKCTKEYFSIANQNRSVRHLHLSYKFVERTDFTILTLVWLHFCVCSFIEYDTSPSFNLSVIMWLLWSFLHIVFSFMIISCCFTYEECCAFGNPLFFLIVLSIVDSVHVLFANRILSGFTIIQEVLLSSFSICIVACFVLENVPLLNVLYVRRSLLFSHANTRNTVLL